MSWKIKFYNSKAEQKLRAWPEKLRSKLAHTFELITTLGPDLGPPITKAFGDGLFEIRIKGQEGIGRVFFCYAYKKQVLILHSFIKKTQKTPKKEIDMARKRLKEVLNHGI